MAYTSWRGVVGVVKPTRRPGSLEELIRMLPEGVGVIPFHLDVRRGTEREFETAIPEYEAKVRELAGEEVDLVVCSGAPPFRLLGPKGEAELVRKWERKYKVAVRTQGMIHVGALKALGIKSFVGASYSALQTRIVVAYMRAAGFKVADMKPIDVPFDRVGQLGAQEVYAHIKKTFLAARGGDGIYIQGGGWRVAPIVETLERDLGVPVVHSVGADCWQIQKVLSVRERRTGYGRLLAELPG